MSLSSESTSLLLGDDSVVVAVSSPDGRVKANIVGRNCSMPIGQWHRNHHRSVTLRTGSRKIGIVKGLRCMWAAEANALTRLVLDGSVSHATGCDATEQGDDGWNKNMCRFHLVMGLYRL